MGEWQNWSELVTQAAVIVAAAAVGVAAGLELLKQMVKALSGKELPAEFMAIASAVLSAGIAARVLIEAGAPWYVAVPACLAALYAPKAAHDVMGKIAPAA